MVEVVEVVAAITAVADGSNGGMSGGCSGPSYYAQNRKLPLQFRCQSMCRLTYLSHIIQQEISKRGEPGKRQVTTQVDVSQAQLWQGIAAT